jgi:hypothetical protein
VATGAALLAKFTALMFLPVCFAAIYVLHPGRVGCSAAKRLAATLAAAFIVLWAGYWFSVADVPFVKGVYMLPLPEAVKEMSLEYPNVPLPAGAFTRGILEAQFYNQFGHWSYLLGERSNRGWWYFFPVVFAVKTPLAFIAFVLVGCYWLRQSPREHWAPGACAIVILAVVLPARINLGVRHILPIFPLLSIPGGYALATMGMSATRGLRYAALVLGLWAVTSSLSAHPDYIGYFNEIAAGEPERFRVDSDLDWGQNMKRLADWIRNKGIRDPIALVYYGATDPSRHGIVCLPAVPWKPSTGWVAASTTPLMLSRERAPDGSDKRPWWWLNGRTPVDSVGGILIFHIPSLESSASRSVAEAEGFER